MTRPHDKATSAQAGFTLVELAVVMIIIGLLIGGVLKGQELITNAQVTATVSQVKSIDAATTTFRDMYDALPGDMTNPAARLANCTSAPCNLAGNGNTAVEGNFAAAPAGEALAFFSHLNAADLVTGINPGANTWGGNFPEAEIGGGFHVSFHGGNATLTNQVGGVAGNVRAGHYLALHSAPASGVGNAAGTLVLTPNQAFRIDSKLDDGQPATGNVLSAGAPTCVNSGVYNELISANDCNLYIRFQN